MILTKNVTTCHPLEKLHPKVPRKKKKVWSEKKNQSNIIIRFRILMIKETQDDVATHGYLAS
jgi:hypothetical protein